MKEKYCSACGREFKKRDLSIRCRLCMCNYHARCWEKSGGCTTWGCPGKPVLSGEEKPDYKRCPYCGEEILSFAVKCRYCRSLLEEPSSLPVLSTDKYGPNHAEPRKDPLLTCLLNLIFPGAGYMYLGKMMKGLFWFVMFCLSYLLARPLGVIAVLFWIMYDSTRQAREMNKKTRACNDLRSG